MTNKKQKKKSNALQSAINTAHDELEAQRKLREDQQVDLNLGRILDSIQPKDDVIAKILELTKGKGTKKVMLTIQDETIRAANDSLWCPDYSLRPHAEQDANCYVGSHWTAIDAPVWKYFVIQCAERCGLPHDLLMDADFVKKLIDQLAKNFFKLRKNYVPDDEVWLNMPDETLVIKSDGTVSCHPHQKDDLFYYSLGYYFDAKAGCPRWLAFLDRVLPEREAQQVLAEYFCYCLMKTHRYERMLWLYGPGANGKSTVLKVLEALLGSANISTASLSQLTRSQKDRIAIEHKMLNISSEGGRDVDPDVLKQLLTGEKVTVERKYHDARQTDDYGKFIVATNRMPKAEDTYAFYRRMIIMPFDVVITDEEKDTQLFDKLKEELPGILNWVLAAFPGLVERNEFTQSRLCDEAMKRYMAQADSVQLFVDQMCEKSETAIRGDYLFAAYQNFCQFMRIDDNKKVGRKYFYKQLQPYAATSGDKEARKFYLMLSE